MAAATTASPARTPPPAPARRPWREPAWWLFAVLITFGLVGLLMIFGPGASRHPAPLLFAAVLFGLHGAFLIWILRRLDYLEPGPIAPVGDIRAVRTARSRRTARWNAYVSGGLAGTRATRRLQRSQADLAGHLVRVDESPATASAEYPAVARALAQISLARVRLDPIGISESDTTRARGTWAGWLAVLGGVATIFTPYAPAGPVGLAMWRVRAARQARQSADPKLLTGVLIGVALFLVWLAFHAVGAVQID